MPGPLKDGFVSGLLGNDLFNAGFGLMGVGFALSALRRGTAYLDIFLKKYCTTTLEIPSKDRSYDWVLSWLSKQRVLANRHMMAQTEFRQTETGKIESSYSFPPASGDHYMIYNGYPIKITRVREKSMIDVTRDNAPFEVLTLRSIGRSSQVFISILEEARKMVIEESEGRTVTFICNGAQWEPFGFPRVRRPLNSVVLEENLSKELTEDLQEFLNSQKWYIDRGIPYRRGYLLYGPPGCGKSSFISALAGHLYYNICVLNLSEGGLSDDRLNYLMNTAPPQSLIVLEDIDSAFSLTEKDVYRVSRSGLLNALDGVTSSEERIIFLTTNHFDKLDPALIRPGRVDVIQKVDYATKFQIIELLVRFYGEDYRSQGEIFANKLTERSSSVSPAQIQGHFLRYKKDPEAALRNYELIFKEF